MAGIQSNLVPLQLSLNGGSTYQTLVCLTQYNVPLDKAVNTVETFCGIAVGLGPTTFNPTGTAVVEASPAAGSQITWASLLTAFEAGTLLRFRVLYPTGGSTGSNISLEGDCYLTNLNLTFQTAQAIQFDFTLTGQGTLDITP